MAVAKVFQTGCSQAIRLPKEFRVTTAEVYLKRTRDGFLVMPKDPWESFAEGIAALSVEAFADPRVQPRLERRP
jgi:antitoxin VapB